MFIPDVPCVNDALFPLCDLLELSFQFVLNKAVLEYRTSILWTPHNVVFAFPCAVGSLTTRLFIQFSNYCGNTDDCMRIPRATH